AGTGALVNFTAVAGAITSITIWIPFVGSGYKAGDIVTVAAGNYDAQILVTAVTSGVPSSGVILYGGTGYVSGTSTALPPNVSIPFTFLFSGLLTGNLVILFTYGSLLSQSNQYIVCNNTTGAYTITVGVSNSTNTGASGGRTVVCPQGTNNSSSIFLQTDGSLNVDVVTPPGGSSGGIQYNSGSSTFAGSAATITSGGSITIPSGQVLDWNSDSDISRLGAASLALGNGTAGDFTGSLKLKSVTLSDTAANTDLTLINTTAATKTAASGAVLVTSGQCAISNDGGGSPLTLNTTGATLIVCVLSDNGDGTITDNMNAAGAWTYLTTQNAGGSVQLTIAYLQNPVVGAGLVFTLNGNFSTSEILAFSNTLTSGVFGAQNGSAGNSPIQPGSITPLAGDLVITAIANGGSGSHMSGVSINGSFVTPITNLGNNGVQAACSYVLNAANSPLNPTWTASVTANNLGAVIASFHSSFTVVNQSSPILTLSGTVYDSAGPSSITDSWTAKNVIHSGAAIIDDTSTLTFA